MNNMTKKFFVLIALVFFTGQLMAQRTITGQVSDLLGNGLDNVSVLVKGTNIGTTTGADGNYTISVPANAKTLAFSSVNFERQEVAIGSSNVINVTLNPAESELQEVVVVGYSQTTKESFTGSAKVIDADELTNKNVGNVSQALAGEASGVRIINTSGQPGTNATVRIRGIGSINGNRAPLYVVDGVPFEGQINSLNPNDVASVTVLKDAAATSIYGSRGANGVIVITTRTGKGKSSFIEVDGKFGSNKSMLPRYDVIRSPETYIALSWEAMYNQAVAKGSADPIKTANDLLFSSKGISPNNNIWNVTSGADLIDPDTRKVKPGVTRKYNPENWEDYAFQPSNRSEVNVRLGGGDSKTNYYSSFGYLDDQGYSIKSNFKRFDARLNLNHEVKKWLSTGVNFNYANTETNNNGQAENSNSIFWFVDNIPSIYPLFLRDKNGDFVPDPIYGGNRFDYGSTGRKFGSLTNAIADATYDTRRSKRNDLTGNAFMTIHFTDKLSLENRVGVQYYNEAYVNFNNKFYGSAASQGGSIFHRKKELLNLNLLNMLRYADNFNAHNVEVLAAHEVTDYKLSYDILSGYNLVTNSSLELNNAAVFNPSESYANTFKLESYFGQVNYDFDKTYFASLTGRRDGSSRFTNDKWGNFGSLGLGWVVTKNALKNVNVLNLLKLKASYGILGDQFVSDNYYPGLDLYEVSNLNNQPSIAFDTKGNPDLTWETSKMFQVGVEFRLGSFLTGSVDYYIKNTDNLVFDRRVGPSSGYAFIRVNDGKLRNKGIEFDLTGHLLRGKDYFLDLNLNGEHVNNEITKMPFDPSTQKDKIIDIQSPYGWSVGHSVYDFYTRNFAGVDPEDGRSTWTVYYEDKNDNGAFDPDEEVTNLEDFLAKNPDKRASLKKGTTKDYAEATQYYIGKSALPTVRGAFGVNAGYKGFELSVLFLYAIGGYSYDYAYATLMGNDLIGGNNWHKDILNRWQKPGDITDVPRLSNKQDQNVNSSSSRFLTDGSYLNLNNIRLSYNVPGSWIESTGFLTQASVFVSGDNLWLASARKGFNPSTQEAGESDMYRYSPLSTLTAGFKVRF